jgi:putative ABC transport system substrate-binding protein
MRWKQLVLQVGVALFVSSSAASPEGMAPRVAVFQQELSRLGYDAGQNLTIEFRWARGEESLKRLAMELIRLNVRMVVTHGVVATIAAREASHEIPIVCFACGDLISTKVVESLARPGGNVTGLTMIHPETSGKRLELLKEILPSVSRVAALYNSGNPVSQPELKLTRDAAELLKLRLHTVGVQKSSELYDAFADMRGDSSDALVVLSDAMFSGQLKLIAMLAMTQRLPSISWGAEFAKAGGLIGYGPDSLALARRAASYVDRVIKGANPRDLPVEQPIKFELAVNLKTAKALGLTVPPTLLATADEVIE